MAMKWVISLMAFLRYFSSGKTIRPATALSWINQAMAPLLARDCPGRPTSKPRAPI